MFKIESTIFVFFFFAIEMFAQSISIAGHRPMAAMLDKLEMEMGFAIHYEDPSYLFAGDLQDVATDEIRLRVNDPKFKILVPKLASFSLLRLNPYVSPSSEYEKMSQIQQAIDGFKSTGLRHEFTLQRSGDAFLVGPSKSANESGALVPVSPLLGNRISIAFQEQSLHEAIGLILDAVSKISKVKVVLGDAKLYNVQRVTVKADNEPASDVLIRVLNQIGPANSISYRALREPLRPYCMVNLQTLGGANRSIASQSVTKVSPPVQESRPYSLPLWFEKPIPK